MSENTEERPLRSREEIKVRLRELHGEYCPHEAGGSRAMEQAGMLVWMLGYEEFSVIKETDSSDPMAYRGKNIVDVSSYVDVEEDDE